MFAVSALKMPVILLFMPLFGWHAGLTASAPTDSTVSMEQEILLYVNEDRAAHGLRKLELNEVESGIAAQHSRNMASGKTPFGHDGLNNRAKAIQKNLGAISAVGENVASGQMSAREVVDGWLRSPGHKRNIEGDFVLTGIGLARNSKGIIYFTQIFSK
jgi:uncharacterized protein YkwD